MTPSTTTKLTSTHRWLARTLLSATLLASTAHAVCISLTGSTACPSFSTFQVNTDVLKNLPAYGIVMPTFATLAEFDKAVLNATAFQTSTDCTGYTKAVRIPYQTTVLCAIAVQDASSNTCKGQAFTNSNMCISSCTLYEQGLSAMVTARCPKATNALAQLAEVKTVCSGKSPADWPGLQDTTTTCINSLQNEATTCGLGTQQDKCAYCKTNTTVDCCKDAVATCHYPTTTTAGTSTTNFIAPPSATSKDGDATGSSKSMSSSTLGAIIGGSVGGVLVLAFLIFLCIRRSKRAEGPQKGANLSRQMSNASSRYNISNPKLQEEGFVSAAPIPMTNLPPVSNNAPYNLGAGAVVAGGAVAGAAAGREATGKQSYCQVLYPYQASMADELDLTPGDIVNVQRVFDDGWAVGVNMSTSNEGAFPVVCVVFVDESALDDDFEDVNMHSMTPMTLREEDEGRRSPSGRNSPRSSLPSRSSSPVHLPRRNSSIRDSTVITPTMGLAQSSPLGPGRQTPPVVRDTMMSDASSMRW
ncbi:hypothetical protein BGZ98_008553 [Dissophora globulifera]|nr:hypothetical protein BGZ98_008553 [Dissophora globulifera]